MLNRSIFSRSDEVKYGEHDEASPCRAGYLRDWICKGKTADEAMVEYTNSNRGRKGGIRGDN